MNLSSVIVIPHPDRLESVKAALSALPGVEVALVSPEGKLVITIETLGDRETIATFETVSLLDGVLSASMVYHHNEAEPDHLISLEAAPQGAVPQTQGGLQ